MSQKMPKYHFRCDACDRDWWQWLSVSESDLLKCPHCNQAKPRKIPVSFMKIDMPSQKKKGAQENVVDHIEENREVLKRMKEETKNKDVLKDD